MPPHLLDARVLEPLAPFLAALGQRDRASLSLACKALYAAMLSAGGRRCTVHEKHLDSFCTWLERLQAAGGCAGLAVELKAFHDVSADPHDALATLCQVAAVGPTELVVYLNFRWRLDSRQQLRAIQALCASTPCRVRTLRICTQASILPALNAITTLQKLECTVWDDVDELDWQPRLPQLTALVVEVEELNLSLDGVPALQQLSLGYEDGGNEAAVLSSVPLGSLTALRLSGGRGLSFPWQQARGLEELVLLGDESEDSPGRMPAPLLGAGELTALTSLRMLALELPVQELPINPAWLGSVTALEAHVAFDARQDGINQALSLIASAPKLTALTIRDDIAPGAHIIWKWAWALLGKVPGSLQNVTVHMRFKGKHYLERMEYSVQRETGEGMAAMLGRLAAQMNDW